MTRGPFNGRTSFGNLAPVEDRDIQAVLSRARKYALTCEELRLALDSMTKRANNAKKEIARLRKRLDELQERKGNEQAVE